ncbi:MAG: heparinase II/III family protein, partial [Planctomycetota bacterium]
MPAMTLLIHGALLLAVAAASSAADAGGGEPPAPKPPGFDEVAALSWEEKFTEPGDEDWAKRWHLDGTKATIETDGAGFTFAAGPKAGADTHHAVLWTRKSFAGDVRISYDYTRLDEAEHYVTILYIQATGKANGQYPRDILKWADARRVPTMSKYFQNMDLLHISYAAMATPQMLARGADDRIYIRTRRYPIPAGGRFDDIVVPPDYYDQDLWQTGRKHHVDVIKRGPYLMMKVTPEGGEPRIMRWDTSGWPPIAEGRIGLRHMCTRSARYENFTVQTLADGAAPFEQGWRKLESVEDAVAAYPRRMRSLMERLDLDRPGLESVKQAMQRDDLAAACGALLDYYRAADTAAWWRHEETPEAGDDEASHVNPSLIEKADAYLDDIYVGHDGPGKMPRNANGHLAWGYTGPRTDQGFRSRVNRHAHLKTLLNVYRQSGKAKYLHRIDQDIRDWLTAADGRLTPWATSPLDVGIRSTRWTEIFFNLQQEPGFRDATRLLMLASLPDHAEFLLENPGGGNWVSMTQRGALTVGLGLLEFRDASKWKAAALAKVFENAGQTVYPDGAQTELTAAYHMVPLTRFEVMADLLRKAGEPVPEDFQDTVTRMWDYIARIVRPDGRRPMNNDSGSEDHTDELVRIAEKYNRGDWLYIATNGERGERPAGPPSDFHPYAGQLISRSGYDADAHWSFFDVGPRGAGHDHSDHGHLSITAFGRDLLTDQGRFTYSGPVADKFRRTYAMHARGHNTILIDGGGQNGGLAVTDHPHPLASVRDDFDFAIGTYADGFENDGGRPLRHTRATVYLRGIGWVVVDRVEGFGEHRIEPLWHFHPDCTVAVEGDQVVTTDPGEGNLRIQPAGDLDWSVEIVKGQETPHPQGWYSRKYGEYRPAPCAVYETTIDGAATFAWIMTPARDTPAAAEVAWLDAPDGVARLRVGFPGQAPRTVTVVMDEAAVPVEPADTVGSGDESRRLIARLLVEQEGEEPRVALGWLERGDEMLAADPIPVGPALLDLATSLQLRSQTNTAGDANPYRHAFDLPLANARFENTLSASLEPAGDNGAGWSLEGLPARDAIPRGGAKPLTFIAHYDRSKTRYPLPELIASLSTLTIEHDPEAVGTTVRLALPLIGSNPPLTAAKATTA